MSSNTTNSNEKIKAHIKSQSLVIDKVQPSLAFSPTNTVILGSRRLSLDHNMLDLSNEAISLNDLIYNNDAYNNEEENENDLETGNGQTNLEQADEYDFMSLKEVEFTGPEIEDKKIKVILITNCRNGELGYHLTKEFLREGHKVIALAPNLSEMSFLEDTPNLDKRILNFESEVYIKYTLKSIAEAYPRIDIICVTPSVDIVGPLSRLEPISDYKVEAVRVLYQLNLLGPLQLIQPIIRNHCRNQKKLSLSFFIMNFGQLPTIWNGLFSSCMNSILTLATSLRLELKPFGMDVLVLRIKSEKSLVYFNNLEYNQLKKDPYYNKLYEYIINKAVISYREIEMELKKYSRHSRRIILNRSNSSHKNYEYVVNSYKLLITYFFYLLSYILPNYEFNFNYFYHQNNPTWPTDQSLFNLNSYFIMDDSFLTYFIPFWFLDWIAWDLSGIGYLHNKDLLTNPSLSPPNYHLKYQNSDSIPNSTYSTNSNTTSTI